MTDLFCEIFPLKPEQIPALFGYQVTGVEDAEPAQIRRLGPQLAAVLGRMSGDLWIWSGGRIIADAHYADDVLREVLDQLQEESPKPYALLQSITSHSTNVTPLEQADYLIRSRLRDLDEPIRQVLRADHIRNAVVEREPRLQPWVVNGAPALSISIASRLLYSKSIVQYLAGETDLAAISEKLNGLWVSERESGLRGEIVQVTAGGQDPTLLVKTGRRDQEFPASALQLIIRLPHLRRFDVDPRQATAALQMRPATRANHVKAVSGVIKKAGLIDNAYNSRALAEQFFSAEFEMNLRFADNRVRPYDPAALSADFFKCGVYKLRKTFNKNPVRVCVLNTLTFPLADFVEALQRQLKRHFTFSIEVIRERQVRVVSESNLTSAIRVLEKEDPDIILAFFADEAGDDDDEDASEGATAAFIKSLTLGRGIPTHVITETTLNDPDAMPAMIMAILGKTGNAPFVLTEPLEHADFVIGLDVARQVRKTTGETTLIAIARVYAADGEFIRYVVREVELVKERNLYLLVRGLFPQKQFADKRVVVHHDGVFPDEMLSALSVWAQAIKASIYPVEIIRFGAPRIYATGKGVIQPPWGSAFKMNDSEALLISSLPKDDVTPQPLHIRTVGAGGPPLAIEKALRGVLVWTLLAYGAERMPKLPVTVLNAEQLDYWLRKGGSFGSDKGDVPFWL